MRKLIESTFTTLNGVIDNPQRWSPPYWDDEHVAYTQGLMEGVEAQVLGRVTYEGFADAWLSRSGDPFADSMNAMPKYVATRTLTEWKWNARPLEGDAVEAVRALKAEGDGELVVLGSGDLVRQLATAGLVDVYQLTVLPVVLGAGTRLFGDMHTKLEPLSSQAFPSGIFVGRFRVVR